MNEGQFQKLADRALLLVEGEDAVHFLQNIVTCDVEGLEPGGCAFGALLTPQGKILFDFFLVRTVAGFLVDAPAPLAADLKKRLLFYRLRARLTVEAAPPALSVFAVWDAEPEPSDGLRTIDPRLPAMGWRVYSQSPPPMAAGSFDAHRIALGMPSGGEDFQYGDAFPHEALMDQFGGVDFRKGCYVGQEVVSRMQHRGTARSRIVMISSGSDLPPTGTEILADGKACGQIGSSVGKSGLAMVRLDRTRAALEAGHALMAGNKPIVARIQAWANFGWPAGRTAD